MSQAAGVLVVVSVVGTSVIAIAQAAIRQQQHERRRRTVPRRQAEPGAVRRAAEAQRRADWDESPGGRLAASVGSPYRTEAGTSIPRRAPGSPRAREPSRRRPDARDRRVKPRHGASGSPRPCEPRFRRCCSPTPQRSWSVIGGWSRTPSCVSSRSTRKRSPECSGSFDGFASSGVRTAAGFRSSVRRRSTQRHASSPNSPMPDSTLSALSARTGAYGSVVHEEGGASVGSGAAPRSRAFAAWNSPSVRTPWACSRASC